MAGLLVLLIIAVLEKVLYRGYVFLNLHLFGSIVFLGGSTLIFVLIHFLTNRVNLHQILRTTILLIYGLPIGLA